MVTGVLAGFRAKVTTTEVGTLTVVKLKTQSGCGHWTVVLVLGLKAPSKPVLPLTN
jgi:hypothetical protein